jgi:thymidylate kinase
MRGRPRPGGLLIALSGIDGAGKSSAADAISARLAERGVPARVSWARLGNRSRLLNRIARPVKRLLRREVTVADPVAAGGPAITKARDVREAERRTPVGWAWVLLVAAVNVRDGRRAARSRRGGVTVICDRWTADALVDLRVRYGRHRAAEALISRALPRPDLAVLLEIDAETSRQRKPGHQADRVLVKMVDLYAETAGRLDLVRIDARRPIDEVVPQLHAAVDGIQAS